MGTLAHTHARTHTHEQTRVRKQIERSRILGTPWLRNYRRDMTDILTAGRAGQALLALRAQTFDQPAKAGEAAALPGPGHIPTHPNLGPGPAGGCTSWCADAGPGPGATSPLATAFDQPGSGPARLWELLENAVRRGGPQLGGCPPAAAASGRGRTGMRDEGDSESDASDSGAGSASGWSFPTGGAAARDDPGRGPAGPGLVGGHDAARPSRCRRTTGGGPPLDSDAEAASALSTGAGPDPSRARASAADWNVWEHLPVDRLLRDNLYF